MKTDQLHELENEEEDREHENSPAARGPHEAPSSSSGKGAENK